MENAVLRTNAIIAKMDITHLLMKQTGQFACLVL